MCANCVKTWQTRWPRSPRRGHSRWMARRQARATGSGGNRAARPCRRPGCDELATSKHGFCPACQAVYERSRAWREQALTAAAAHLEREHRELVHGIAPHPAHRALLLRHAAAHNDLRGAPGSGITVAAVRDFLDEAMEAMVAERYDS